MRLDFDKSVSEHDQRSRVAESKRVGRKHNHRPSQRVNDRRKAGQRHAAHMRRVKAKKLSAKVSAYFRGEVESYPE